MGNIEIRDQSTTKRRTNIFSHPRNSLDPNPQDYRKSLTHRYQHSPFSPIRFSKLDSKNPLTERKPNTLQLQNVYSPILNQQTLRNSKSPTYRQNQKPNLQKILIDQNLQFQHLSQKTGKIVSNSNKRLQDQKKSYQAFQQIMAKDRPLNSPLQTKQIIRKVRNFNDFLNQIKRKLKQDKQETLLRNKSRLEQFNNNLPSQKITLPSSRISPFKQSTSQPSNQQANLQKSKSMRRIEVALKLENQKIQLQKYRKLVERELSKTHSIQNISLCTKNSGQKILTIQYESLLNQNMFEENKSTGSLTKQPSQKSLINRIMEHEIPHKKVEQKFKSEIHTEMMTKPSKPQLNQSTLLKRLKLQYEKMLQNVLDLGKTIQRYEMNGSMIESQVVDNKIMIQEGIDFVKKGSQLSQKSYNYRQSFERQGHEESLTKMKQTQIRELEQASRTKLSQASERSAQKKIETNLSHQQSQRSSKQISQKSQRSFQGSKISNQQTDNFGINCQTKDQIKQKADLRIIFSKEGSRASKAESNTSKKSNKIQYLPAEEREISEKEENYIFTTKSSQVAQKGDQPIQRGSQASRKNTFEIGQNQEFKNEDVGSRQVFTSEEISFSSQSEQPNFFAPVSNETKNYCKQLEAKDSKQKIERIQSLFDKLNELQSEYQETDREVREALGGEIDQKSQIEQDSSIL